jgi:hypothetical protein
MGSTQLSQPRNGLLIRLFDWLMVLYFLLHVPITVLVDSQSVVPRQYYPDWAVKAVDDHVRDHGDHLVRDGGCWGRKGLGVFDYALKSTFSTVI